MSYFGLFAHSAVAFGLLVLSHCWGAEAAESKAAGFTIQTTNFQALSGAERERAINELIHQQAETPARHQPVVTSVSRREKNVQEKLILLASELTAEKSTSGTRASRLTDSPSKESSRSSRTKPVKPATLPLAIAAATKGSVPKSMMNASTPAEQETSLGKSPSILQMLEGREQDLIIAAAIAVAFFSVGWLCGGIYYLRRDRKRRTKLRF